MKKGVCRILAVLLAIAALLVAMPAAYADSPGMGTITVTYHEFDANGDEQRQWSCVLPILNNAFNWNETGGGSMYGFAENLSDGTFRNSMNGNHSGNVGFTILFDSTPEWKTHFNYEANGVHASEPYNTPMFLSLKGLDIDLGQYLSLRDIMADNDYMIVFAPSDARIDFMGDERESVSGAFLSVEGDVSAEGWGHPGKASGVFKLRRNRGDDGKDGHVEIIVEFDMPFIGLG